MVQGISWVEPDSFVKILDGPLDLAKAEVGASAVDVGADELRVDANGSVEFGYRVFLSPLLLKIITLGV